MSNILLIDGYDFQYDYKLEDGKHVIVVSCGKVNAKSIDREYFYVRSGYFFSEDYIICSVNDAAYELAKRMGVLKQQAEDSAKFKNLVERLNENSV